MASSAENYSSDPSEFEELSPISSSHSSPRRLSSNPTEILQTEYNSFKDQKRHVNFRVNLDTPCSREDFYYALRSINKFDHQGSIALIEKCTQSVGNPADPVDATIHYYSKLIYNYYNIKKRRFAELVCDFLRGEGNVLKNKNQVFYLILTDPIAYDTAPQEIKDEILISLSDRSSYLHLVLSTKEPNSPDVVQANAILHMNGLPNVRCIPQTRVQKQLFSDYFDDTFGQYKGGRKLKLKLRSKSRSSRNKSKRKNKNKKNKKKTLRLRIKK